MMNLFEAKLDSTGFKFYLLNLFKINDLKKDLKIKIDSKL